MSTPGTTPTWLAGAPDERAGDDPGDQAHHRAHHGDRGGLHAHGRVDLAPAEPDGLHDREVAPAALHAGEQQVPDRHRPEDREEHRQRERDAIDLLEPVHLERHRRCEKSGIPDRPTPGRRSMARDATVASTPGLNRTTARATPADVLRGLEPAQTRRR